MAFLTTLIPPMNIKVYTHHKKTQNANLYTIELRKIIVSSILSTDMAHHSDYVNQIKQQAYRFHHEQIQNEETERILLCCALIKCADISNVARPFRRGAKWAQLLVQEFVCQGDLERERGMHVVYDRNQLLEESQIGFIRFVALDLFQNVREVLNEISFAVDQMQANLKQWETCWTVHDTMLVVASTASIVPT